MNISDVKFYNENMKNLGGQSEEPEIYQEILGKNQTQLKNSEK